MSGVSFFSAGLGTGWVLLIASALAVARLWPRLSRALARGAPVQRARWALATALAPWLAPVALAVLILLPGLLSAASLHADHCPLHAEHPHLCVIHPSAALWPVLAGLGLLPGAALVAVGLAGLLRRSHLRRWLSHFERSSARLGSEAVTVLECEPALSVAVGSGAAGIVISRGLLRSLSAGELEVVLAHERAHLERRDALRQLVVRVLSRALPPGTRDAVRAELALACEQSCDERAADRTGDRLAVAETLLNVERLSRIGAPLVLPAAAVPSFGGSTLPARVRALLGGPVPALRCWWLHGAATGLVGIAIVLCGVLHHVAEHALARLAQLLA